MLDYPSKEAIEKINQSQSLTEDLNHNITLFKGLFKDDDTFEVREFVNKNDDLLKFCIFHLNGMVNTETINENIIKPLMFSKIEINGNNRLDVLASKYILISIINKTADIQKLIENVTYGDTILLVDGEKEALILNTKSFSLRSIEEPSSELILNGPREGFNESLLVNLSLIRRKIRSNKLKMKFYTFGRRTNTKACICYIENLADPEILDELYRRLDKIDIDGMLDTNYIKELIRDSRITPFRTIGTTERPDVVAAKLLEGRIAVLLDGTPVALTLPFLFVESLQSNEDYYLNFLYSSFERFIRMLSFILTIIVPGLYISTVGYHHDLIPFELFLSFTGERTNVPLPAAIEAFLLFLVFDIIKEAGMRMPSSMGQALSIVGALVIGQSAVEAGLIAAPMVIVVAITAITSLLIPALRAPSIAFRYLLLFMASVMGYFGLVVGASIVLIHILSIRSFGMPYLTPLDRLSLKPQELKDIILRAPWCKMKERPAMAVDIERNIGGSGDN